MNTKQRWEMPALLMIIAAGALLRIGFLSSQSMWSDEIGTLLVSAKPLYKAVATILLSDINPPFFYVIAHFWQYLGHGETVLRLLPALCGLACLPLLYAMLRRWTGTGAAMLAAGLLAIWPAHVYFSGEFRYQTLTGLLSILSWWGFVGMLSGGEKRWHRLYLISTIIGLYTHYFFLFICVAQLLVAWRSRRFKDVFTRKLLYITLFFLPGLAVLGWQIAQRNWAIKSLLSTDHSHRLFDLLSLWTVGGVPWHITTCFTWLDQVQCSSPRLFPWLFLALTVPLLWLLIRGARQIFAQLWGKALVFWAVVPAALLLFLSLFAPVFDVKLLAPTLPALAAIMACGAWRANKKTWGILAVAWFLVLSSLAIWQHNTDPRFFRDDWRRVAGRLSEDIQPGDVVLNATFELRHYATRPLPEKMLITTTPREFLRRGRRQPKEETEAHIDKIIDQHQRIWFQPNPMKGIQIVDDAEAHLRSRLYDATPSFYRQKRPRMMLFIVDRRLLAREKATVADRRIRFTDKNMNREALRGKWLPTEEGWWWTTNSASAWLRNDGAARLAQARIYVNTDLFPEQRVTVRLLVENEIVAEKTIADSEQYALEGPLPESARSLPAVELRITADKIIYQDTNNILPRDQARTVLVRELALSP